jgi:hypothetical protein
MVFPEFSSPAARLYFIFPAVILVACRFSCKGKQNLRMLKTPAKTAVQELFYHF